MQNTIDRGTDPIVTKIEHTDRGWRWLRLPPAMLSSYGENLAGLWGLSAVLPAVGDDADRLA
jgi:hypothetical protein